MACGFGPNHVAPARVTLAKLANVALFGRRDRPTDPRPAIEQFWSWWSENRDEVIAAGQAEDIERVRVLLAPAVAAMDAGLDWEFRIGKDGPHTLVVTGGPKLELRGLAERWALASSADDKVEFAPSRLPDPGAFETTSTVEGYDVQLGETVVGARIDQEHGRLDVSVHHPLFPLLGDGARLTVAFRSLYAALGEDDVERWLGEVKAAADPPIDAFPVSALPPLTEQLRGKPHWIELTGKSRLGAVRASVQRPLSRVDRPLCDTYLAVVVPYPAGRDGLPDVDHVSTAVRDFRAELLRAAGGDGPHAVAIGHELMAKRAYMHIYVDGLTFDRQPVEDVLASWPFGTGKITLRDDPGWRRVSRLL